MATSNDAVNAVVKLCTAWLANSSFLPQHLGYIHQACPITKDDSYERHFRATTESWQQQAAISMAAGTISGRPGSGGVASMPAARLSSVAVAKDRPKQAQAALERHLAAVAAQQTASLLPAAAIMQGLSALSIPGSAATAAPAAAGVLALQAATTAIHAATTGGSGAGTQKTSRAGKHKTGSGGSVSGAGGASEGSSTVSSVQCTPRLGSSLGGLESSVKQPAVVVQRQLKNGDTLILCPQEQVRKVTPASTGDAELQPTPSGRLPAGSADHQQQQVQAVLGQVQLVERLHQLQAAVDRDAGRLRAGQQQPTIGALQAQQVGRRLS